MTGPASEPHPAASERARLATVLGPSTALVSVLGLLAEIGHYQWGLAEATTELFSLSYEGNLPTWYASALLLTAGLLVMSVAGRVSREGGAHRWRWWFLGGAFIYMSLDEAIEIHEHLAYTVPFETGGVLYFGWVIPASLIVVVVGVVYVPFLRALPRDTRRRFVLAGALFVGGALGMEFPLGAWADYAGQDNLGYGLLDWVEETLELSGATLFVAAVAARRAGAEAAQT